MFLLASVPVVVAIALAGGLIALVPLLLLIVPILALGRPIGVETLDRIREQLSERDSRRRPTNSGPPRRFGFDLFTPRTGRLLANSLAERGPPAVVLNS